MQKGSTLTAEHKDKISQGVRRRLEEKGGFTEEHKQNLASAQKRRYAEIRDLIKAAKELGLQPKVQG
jgi:uncharacterized membrane-anchored protein